MSIIPELPSEATPGLLGEIVDTFCENSEATRGFIAADALVNYSAWVGGALTFPIWGQQRQPILYMFKVGPDVYYQGEGSVERLFSRVDKRCNRRCEGPLGGASSFTPVSLLKVLEGRRYLIDMHWSSGFALMERKGVGQLFRDAFGGGPLEAGRTSIFDYHLALTGYLTPEELMQLKDYDSFLMVSILRDKVVASPARTPDSVLEHLADEVIANAARVFEGRLRPESRKLVSIGMSPGAQEYWEGAKSFLLADKGSPSMMGQKDYHPILLATLIAAFNGKREVDIDSIVAGVEWTRHSISVIKHYTRIGPGVPSHRLGFTFNGRVIHDQ